jgi:hypothetical protein
MFDAIDRIIAMTDGVDEERLNWVPAPGANSLFVLATHVLGSAEETVLNTLCAVRPSTRDREAEFAVAGASTADIAAHWQSLRSEIDAAMDKVTRAQLEATLAHPRRGEITGYEVLLVAVTHPYEHLAHAELTTQLLAAR